MKMKKNFKNYLLFGMLGLLALSSIFLTIETATTGLEISKMEKSEKDLARQKSELEQTLVRTLSMGELQEKSSGMGFTKPSNLVYITPTENVAKLP